METGQDNHVQPLFYAHPKEGRKKGRREREREKKKCEIEKEKK